MATRLMVERPRRARALVVVFGQDERDELFLGMNDREHRHKTHYQILSATHLRP